MGRAYRAKSLFAETIFVILLIQPGAEGEGIFDRPGIDTGNQLRRSILGKYWRMGSSTLFDRPKVNRLAHTQGKNALDNRSGRMELVNVRSTEIAFEHQRAVFGDQDAVDAVVSGGFDAVDQANSVF